MGAFELETKGPNLNLNLNPESKRMLFYGALFSLFRDCQQQTLVSSSLGRCCLHQSCTPDVYFDINSFSPLLVYKIQIPEKWIQFFLNLLKLFGESSIIQFFLLKTSHDFVLDKCFDPPVNKMWDEFYFELKQVLSLTSPPQ
jgi:hypothetical protein